MSNNLKIVIGAVVVLILGVIFVTSGGAKSVGSIGTSEGYYSTTTTTSFASTQKVLTTANAIFGSVVVASTTGVIPTATLLIKNATSTSDVSSTTLASFSGQPVAGTYTFDMVAPRGIIIETGAGFNGSYVLTWK